MKIAIVGGGAAGLGAAWALAPHHKVTIFEKSARFGGHANTHEIECDGTIIAADSGFMIHNAKNYPNLTSLFREIGIQSRPTDMSVSVTGDVEIEWSSNAVQILRSIGAFELNPKFFPLVMEIYRFNRRAKQQLKAREIPDVKISEYFRAEQHSSALLNCYLAPIVTAIWSMPVSSVPDFPAPMLIRFFENHSLLDFGRANWQTIVGGTKNYVERLVDRTKAELKLSEPVLSVAREPQGVVVKTTKSDSLAFDHVVLACHPNDALTMLADQHPDERRYLSAIPYTESLTILHRDERLMPENRNRWASWNCVIPQKAHQDSFSVTYNLNKIQGIDPAYPLYVSLRPHKDIRADRIFAEMTYHHPLYSSDMLKACDDLQAIQGRNHTWFAGAYLGSGFHEDAFKSGLDVAECINAMAVGKQNSERNLSAAQ